MNTETVKIQVKTTEDGKHVIVKVNNEEIELQEPQVNELIERLIENRDRVHANLNGWIFCA